MAYLSWTLARLILNRGLRPLEGWRLVTLPSLAAAIIVAWDLSLDPVWSTILRAWIWRDGGTYFGVPLSNFCGWYLTVFLIYQLFALSTRNLSTSPEPMPVEYWRQPVFFYAVSAVGNLLLLLLPQSRFLTAVDPTGVRWKAGDIIAACALVTIFTMGIFTALAWLRLASPQLAAGPFRGGAYIFRISNKD